MLAFYSLPLALLAAIASSAPTPVDNTNTIGALLSERSSQSYPATLSTRDQKEIYLPGYDKFRIPTAEDKAQAAASGTVCPEFRGVIFYIAWPNAQCPA